MKLFTRIGAALDSAANNVANKAASIDTLKGIQKDAQKMVPVAQAVGHATVSTFNNIKARVKLACGKVEAKDA